MRVLFLAAGAMTLSVACSAAERAVPWCPLAPTSPQEEPGAEPRPCVPFAQVLEEAKRKAREAERRDEEEISAMRSLAAQALAGDNQQTQKGQRREAKPVVSVRTSSRPDRTDEDTAGELAGGREAASLPVRVTVEPPKRPRNLELQRRQAQQTLLAAALKRKQAVQARIAAELRRAQARVTDLVPGETAPTLAPSAFGSAWPMRLLTIREASGDIPIIPMPNSLRPTRPPAAGSPL